MEARKQYSDTKINLEKNMYNINNSQRKNVNNNSNRAILNFNNIINNLKLSLEKFDTSIRELKLNMDNDKKEKTQKIQQLEDTFNSKLNSLMNGQKFNESAQKEKNRHDISPKIIKEIISKINFLEQKSKEIEYDFNNKLIETDNNNKITFDQIIQKINEKPQNEFSSRTYKRNAESPLSKNIEVLVKKKIDEYFDRKIEIVEEKIQILNNKVINLEIKSQNKMYERNLGENSIKKDNSFNDAIISDKLDKKIQALNNSMNNKLIKFANFLGIEDLKEIDLDDSNMNINDEKNDDTQDIDLKELDKKLMNEITNKLKIINDNLDDKINNNIDNKINDIKKTILQSIDENNDKLKDTNEDINSKISSLKSEISKMIEENNSYLDNKIKNLDNEIKSCLMDNESCLDKINSLETKLKTMDNKIRITDNKFENITTDSNIINDNNKSLNNSKTLLKDNPDYKNSNSNLSANKLTTDKSFFLDTNILNKEYLSENFFLFSKIKETFPYDMTIIYKLIYRASKHGDSARDFHSKCDYIGPNLILVKTKKDFIFGGVTSKSWKHLLKDIKKEEPEYGTEIKDDKAFGFSINLKKIYPNGKPNEVAILCNKNFGPVFKNIYFKIFDECFQKGGLCGKIEESNFIGQEKDYEFNGEEEKFEVEDIEIFQIGFK